MSAAYIKHEKMIKYFSLFLFCFWIKNANAQDDWDLRRCVDYAMANNITVQQADVQARIAALQTKLSKAQLIPTLGFNTQAGYQFGRNIDPTTNQFTNSKVFFQLDDVALEPSGVAKLSSCPSGSVR